MALNLQSPEQLQQLEAMVERMYKSQNQQERTQAENTLRIFSTSTEQIPQCRVILENSTVRVSGFGATIFDYPTAQYLSARR